MRWAMILAAGRGEECDLLTDSKPKPLMNVNSKPLIIYHIEVPSGFRRKGYCYKCFLFG